MRTRIIPAKEYVEDIHAYTWNTATKTVAIAIGAKDKDTGEFVPNQTFDTIIISGKLYDALLSANGNGLVPGKPAGTFRKEDLWPFIDKIRSV